MKIHFPAQRISLPMLALAALFCAPAGGFAQTILESAGNFAILGGTGVTNTGPTDIMSGDVGSTAITNFPPGTVTNGGVIVTDPAVITPALTDLTNVETKLALMPSTADLSGQDLGGMTLLPGVYTFTGAATLALSTNLTLDANGETNPVWVFQINSSFTSGANANILLTNLNAAPGSDAGIYWDAGTFVTFGANDEIIGNFLAGTAITFGSETDGSGRALGQTINTLSDNNLDSDPGASPSGWNSGLMYNAQGDIVPVPEPSAVLWLTPLGALGLVFWRRRSVAKTNVA
jgi:hypothetical protein